MNPLKNELEKLLLSWWLAVYPRTLVQFTYLTENDFTDFHKDLFNELSSGEHKTNDEVAFSLLKKGRREIIKWTDKMNSSGGYAENYIKDKINELININKFTAISEKLENALNSQKHKLDAYELAQQIQEISDETIQAIQDSQRVEETQYIQSREWFSQIDDKRDGIKFTNMRFLDELHFEPSHLIALNGVVKNGKTTLALAMGFEQEAQGKKFAYISAEMTPKEINSKFFSFKFDIANHLFDNPEHLDTRAREMIKDYISKMSKEPLFRFEIHNFLTLNMVHTYIKRFADNGINFIIIDYYQKIFLDSKYKSREEELAFISAKLKSYALKYNVCICAISQMNRGGFNSASAGNVAGGMGLNRDADFIFNIYKPSSMLDTKGSNSVKIDGELVYFDKHDFMLNLEFSRHTRGDGYALLNRTISGRMVTKWENFSKAMDYNFIPMDEAQPF